MKIRLGDLRRIIRETLTQAGGAVPNARRPVVNNPMSPSMADREQIGRISVKDIDEPDEIAPHLRDPLYDEEDCWGPVPPTAENPHVGPDVYAKDFNVIPTSSIKR